MNWVRFLFFLTLGVAIVLAQAVASWFDGYLTQAQMHSRGIAHGWSFLEHGGRAAAHAATGPRHVRQ